MFLVATNAAPRVFLETRLACHSREQARTAAIWADSMAAVESRARRAGSSRRPTERSLYKMAAPRSLPSTGLCAFISEYLTGSFGVPP